MHSGFTMGNFHFFRRSHLGFWWRQFRKSRLSLRPWYCPHSIVYRQWQRLAELGWFQLLVTVPYIIHPMCIVWHVFLGGCAWKMAGSAGCLPKLFSFWGQKNSTKPWSANFIGTFMMWFQISKSAEIYPSIEEKNGWYNQNIAERWHFIGRANYLNILAYTWMDLMHHDTSIHQISSFHPFHQHSNRMRRSLPTSRHEREQSACFVTSPSAFGACESFWRTKGLSDLTSVVSNALEKCSEWQGVAGTETILF